MPRSCSRVALAEIDAGAASRVTSSKTGPNASLPLTIAVRSLLPSATSASRPSPLSTASGTVYCSHQVRRSIRPRRTYHCQKLTVPVSLLPGPSSWRWSVAIQAVLRAEQSEGDEEDQPADAGQQPPQQPPGRVVAVVQPGDHRRDRRHHGDQGDQRGERSALVGEDEQDVGEVGGVRLAREPRPGGRPQTRVQRRGDQPEQGDRQHVAQPPVAAAQPAGRQGPAADAGHPPTVSRQPVSSARWAAASTRTTSRPKATSHGWAPPVSAAACSSVTATRWASTATRPSGSRTSRPASPCTQVSMPEASCAAVEETVTVLARPSGCARTRCTVSPCPRPACTAVTGPSAGTSRDSACGPTSHSAPCSRRHGVSNGEPASEPSQVTAPPARVVRVACSSQVEVAVRKRLVKNTTEATPEAVTASTTRSAAATDRATGFSRSRCLPAAAARSASGACTSGGSAKLTASTSASSASRSSVPGTSNCAPTPLALARSRPHTPTSSASGCPAREVACTSLAQKPVPSTPKRMSDGAELAVTGVAE